MNTDEITEWVRQRGDYGSAEEARRVTDAVLNALSACDLGGEAARLADQLPRELGEQLREPAEEASQFGAPEFLARLADRAQLTEAQAEAAAGAVLSSVTDAVTPGQRTSFLNALPRDLSGYARTS